MFKKLVKNANNSYDMSNLKLMIVQVTNRNQKK